MIREVELFYYTFDIDFKWSDLLRADRPTSGPNSLYIATIITYIFICDY